MKSVGYCYEKLVMVVLLNLNVFIIYIQSPATSLGTPVQSYYNYNYNSNTSNNHLVSKNLKEKVNDLLIGRSNQLFLSYCFFIAYKSYVKKIFIMGFRSGGILQNILF